MSHNLFLIDGQELNQVSELTQSIDTLSNVSTNSPSDNQLLSYSGSTWTKGQAEPNKVASVVGINTATGSYSAAYYSQVYEDADGFYINLRWQYGTPQYLLTLVNTATYADHLIKTFAVNSKWWKGFALEPGYKFQLVADICIPENSDAGAYAELQWKTSSGVACGPRGFARRPSENKTRFVGFIDLTSESTTTNVGLFNHGMSGYVAFIQAGVDNIQNTITARIIES